jgi:hypothetical protein
MATMKELRGTVDVLMRAGNDDQAAIGRAIGLTQGQVSRKQNGKAAWTLDDCDRLAAYWSITVPQLLSGSPVALDAAWPAIKRRLTGAEYDHIEGALANLSRQSR